MADEAKMIIRSADDLVEAFRVRKAQLGISNAEIEAQLLWSDGMADKFLGPSRTLQLTAPVIEDLMSLFAIEFTMQINRDLDAKRRGRLQRRDERQVRPQSRLSRQLMEVANRQLYARLSQLGNEARKAKLPPEARQRIARAAARARWQRHRAAAEAAAVSEGTQA
jgi:hypothetical protein